MPLKHIPQGKGGALFGSFPSSNPPKSAFRTFAIQAMDGKGTLSLSTKSRNGMVAVPIGATGSGNSKDFVGRIFTPFSPSKLSAKGPDWGFMLLSLSLPNTKGRFP